VIGENYNKLDIAIFSIPNKLIRAAQNSTT